MTEIEQRQAAVVSAVRKAGGIARTRSLAAAGHSKHHQAVAVAAGVLRRVGRSWLAVPTIDPRLELAARSGVVLTCVTEAKRRGLWVLEDGGCHVGADPHGRSAPGCQVHWSAPPVPRHPDTVVDPIENVLAIVAECRPHDEALAVWESALKKSLVTVEALRRLPLRPAARALCDEVSPWSDSGLESIVRPRLRFLRLRIVQQVWIAGHRVDFLIGARLVLQVDGGSHVGAQREEDIAHDALLMLMGYHVIRVGYDQVVGRWHEVQDLIMRAVAQGLHLDR
ncbi:MAG: DUF559 domain-containing protein [Microbacterium sp.]